jgi:hypothetical protein
LRKFILQNPTISKCSNALIMKYGGGTARSSNPLCAVGTASSKIS